MARVRLTQTQSLIKRPATQKLAMKSLGLGRIGKSIELDYNPSIAGNINKVAHLVRVEMID